MATGPHRKGPFVVVNPGASGGTGAGFKRTTTKGKHAQKVHQHKGRMSGGPRKGKSHMSTTHHKQEERTMPAAYEFETEIAMHPALGIGMKAKMGLDSLGFRLGDKVRVRIEIIQGEAATPEDWVDDADNEADADDAGADDAESGADAGDDDEITPTPDLEGDAEVGPIDVTDDVEDDAASSDAVVLDDTESDSLIAALTEVEHVADVVTAVAPLPPVATNPEPLTFGQMLDATGLDMRTLAERLDVKPSSLKIYRSSNKPSASVRAAVQAILDKKAAQ